MGTGPDAGERLCAALLTFLESAESGAPVDRDSLLADYPDLSLELRDFLDGYALVERVTAPVRTQARGPRGATVRREPCVRVGTRGAPVCRWPRGLPPPGDVSASR
jgi:hypothetical protein